ncbi:MAG TPA: TetR/AcrR family transcriptional regulator [Acidimicrobiia bacterium]
MSTRLEAPRRAPGRPRSLEADEAILEATVDVFAEVGLEALTMEGVAARAGVSKNTVYRRFPNKLDLVVSAVRCYTNVGAPPPDTGTTRGDVQALVDDLVAIVTATPMGRMLPILVAARTRTPELDLAYSEIVADKRARSAAVVRRGITRGDFRTDVDIDLVVDAFVSPVFYRLLVTNAPLDEAFRTAVVDAALRAFGA